MNQKAKKKLCWNCEGEVDLKVEKCTYCGVSMDVTPIPGTQPKKTQTNPPYKPNKTAASIPTAPYPLKEEAVAALEESKSPGREFQNSAIAIGFLLLGSVLTIFSLVLLIFGDGQGKLTLSWNSAYWYYYLLLALPLLFLGWRAAANSDSESV